MTHFGSVLRLHKGVSRSAMAMTVVLVAGLITGGLLIAALLNPTGRL
jgi:hypothetical protein